MNEEYLKFLSEQRTKYSVFGIEQDKIYNRYVTLGSAGALTLLINLVANHTELFVSAEKIHIAMYCFGVPLVLNAFCLFLNARLATFMEKKSARIEGIIIGYKASDEKFPEFSPEARSAINSEAGKFSKLYDISRLAVLLTELVGGVIFATGICLALLELSKIL